MSCRLLLFVVMIAAACGAESTAPAQAAAPTTATALPTVTSTPAVATSTPTPTSSPAPSAETEPEATAEPEPTPPATPAPVVEEAPTTPQANCRIIDDFAGNSAQWQVVLDGVMGGLSSGQATISDGLLTLTGTINTNGGGFVQVRRAIDPADLAGATSVRFIAIIDGRSYEAFTTDALAGRARSVSHFATIDFSSPDADALVVGTIALADLQARSFGTPIVTEAFRPDLAISIGVILADGVDGEFVLTLDRIEACQ